MNTNILRDLFSYTDYANEMLLAETARLDAEDFTRDVSPSHGSVAQLLHHMLNVEGYFLLASQLRADEFVPQYGDTVDEITGHWRELSRSRSEYLSSMTVAELSEEIPLYFGESPLMLPRYQLLLQSFTHSVHHRGELSIVLSGLGHPLPTLDSILYYVQSSGQEWPFE
jgi:uncharacterized damage-inducible protein DinB